MGFKNLKVVDRSLLLLKLTINYFRGIEGSRLYLAYGTTLKTLFWVTLTESK